MAYLRRYATDADFRDEERRTLRSFILLTGFVALLGVLTVVVVVAAIIKLFWG
jgi:hypothetical protein